MKIARGLPPGTVSACHTIGVSRNANMKMLLTRCLRSGKRAPTSENTTPIQSVLRITSGKPRTPSSSPLQCGDGQGHQEMEYRGGNDPQHEVGEADMAVVDERSRRRKCAG